MDVVVVVLRINVDLAIFQPYLDLEAGDNQSLKIQVARPGIEPRSSCSASQELNHSATAAPDIVLTDIYVNMLPTQLLTMQTYFQENAAIKLNIECFQNCTRIASQIAFIDMLSNIEFTDVNLIFLGCWFLCNVCISPAYAWLYWTGMMSTWISSSPVYVSLTGRIFPPYLTPALFSFPSEPLAVSPCPSEIIPYYV